VCELAGSEIFRYFAAFDMPADTGNAAWSQPFTLAA